MKLILITYVESSSYPVKWEFDGTEHTITYGKQSRNYYDDIAACHEFGECDALQPFVDAGKPVFNAEYADSFVNDATERAALCANARDQDLRTLVLPIDLDDSLRFSCDP